MKSLVFIVCVTTVALLSGSFAQNAPAVNWALVRPIHQLPSFFQDYPFLFELFQRFSPGQLQIPEEGRNATRNQFAYQVGLVLTRTDGQGFCSGSLLSNTWILTAGHCSEHVTTGTAILGGWDIQNGVEVGQSRFIVTQFMPHPGWNGLRLTDDVGLVQLPTPVIFTATIQPIRLANYRQVSTSFQNQMTLMTGWGRSIFSAAVVARNTRFAQFHVFSSATCRLFYPNILETAQICAVSSDPSGPLCPGDSGSALTVVEADNIPTQIGVNSFISGLGCAPGRPAVFARLNFYLLWISRMTNIVISNVFVF